MPSQINSEEIAKNEDMEFEIHIKSKDKAQETMDVMVRGVALGLLVVLFLFGIYLYVWPYASPSRGADKQFGEKILVAVLGFLGGFFGGKAGAAQKA